MKSCFDLDLKAINSCNISSVTGDGRRRNSPQSINYQHYLLTSLPLHSQVTKHNVVSRSCSSSLLFLLLDFSRSFACIDHRSGIENNSGILPNNCGGSQILYRGLHCCFKLTKRTVPIGVTWRRIPKFTTNYFIWVIWSPNFEKYDVFCFKIKNKVHSKVNKVCFESLHDSEEHAYCVCTIYL